MTNSVIRCIIKDASSSSLSNCLFGIPFSSQKMIKIFFNALQELYSILTMLSFLLSQSPRIIVQYVPQFSHHFFIKDHVISSE